MSEQPKTPRSKAASFYDKMCNQCWMKQGATAFQACSGCKQVLYCSKACQKSNWKIHKPNCQKHDLFVKKVHEEPEYATASKIFDKWEHQHLHLLTQAIICALDLANKPSNVDTMALMLQVQLEPHHATIPLNQKLKLDNGIAITLQKARELLGTEGKPFFDSHDPDEIKKQGALGSVPIIYYIKHSKDTVQTSLVRIPPLHLVKDMQAQNDWGSNWVKNLRSGIDQTHKFDSKARDASLSWARNNGT